MVNRTDMKISYRGNGSTTVFPFSFPFLDKGYICVAIYDSTTGETKKLTKDYYVDATANTVSYPGYAPGQAPAASEQPAALSSTQTITIYRKTDIDQLTNLGDKYPLPSIEAMSDKATEIIQELADDIARSVKIPQGDPTNPDEALLNLQNYVKSANSSAQQAAQSASNASGSEQRAKSSENNAKSSETNAKASEDNAKRSADAADASQKSAAASQKDAYTSKTSAASSAEEAANRELIATNAAESAGKSERNSKSSEENAKKSEQNAKMSALEAASSAQQAASLEAASELNITKASNTVAAVNAMSVPTWESGKEYSYPDVVAYLDGLTYRCIGEKTKDAPATSQKWVPVAVRGGDDFWEIDYQGGLQPQAFPRISNNWALDTDGNIVPKGLADEAENFYTLKAEEAAQRAESAAEEAVNATTLELDSDDNLMPKEKKS